MIGGEKMSKKERVLVYPFNIQFSPILRHQELLKDYEIVRLVSPNGWGFVGKDAGCSDKGGNVGINVTGDFEESLEACDTVMFIESLYSLDFLKVIYPKIIKTLDSHKNIICTLDLDPETLNQIEGLCSHRGVTFKYFSNKVLKPEKEYSMEEIKRINTPVVFVLGTVERVNKFEIQLSLRENILKMGYSISQVGTRSYCELLGFHSFPQFMFENTFSESEKIILFNTYIKKIQDEEKPDIIVIGIPGGIMPLNNKHPNKFGITAFEVSQAVTPDVSVCSLIYEDYKNTAFESYFLSCKYKLGFDIDCFNIANSRLDWEDMRETGKISYLSIDTGFIDKKKEDYSQVPTPVFNILNTDDAFKMVCCLIDKLSDYGKTQVI